MNSQEPPPKGCGKSLAPDGRRRCGGSKLTVYSSQDGKTWTSGELDEPRPGSLCIECDPYLGCLLHGASREDLEVWEIVLTGRMIKWLTNGECESECGRSNEEDIAEAREVLAERRHERRTRTGRWAPFEPQPSPSPPPQPCAVDAADILDSSASETVIRP